MTPKDILENQKNETLDYLKQCRSLLKVSQEQFDQDAECLVEDLDALCEFQKKHNTRLLNVNKQQFVLEILKSFTVEDDLLAFIKELDEQIQKLQRIKKEAQEQVTRIYHQEYEGHFPENSNIEQTWAQLYNRWAVKHLYQEKLDQITQSIADTEQLLQRSNRKLTRINEWCQKIFPIGWFCKLWYKKKRAALTEDIEEKTGRLRWSKLLRSIMAVKTRAVQECSEESVENNLELCNRFRRKIFQQASLLRSAEYGLHQLRAMRKTAVACLQNPLEEMLRHRSEDMKILNNRMSERKDTSDNINRINNIIPLFEHYASDAQCAEREGIPFKKRADQIVEELSQLADNAGEVPVRWAMIADCLNKHLEEAQQEIAVIPGDDFKVRLRQANCPQRADEGFLHIEPLAPFRIPLWQEHPVVIASTALEGATRMCSGMVNTFSKHTRNLGFWSLPTDPSKSLSNCLETASVPEMK